MLKGSNLFHVKHSDDLPQVSLFQDFLKQWDLSLPQEKLDKLFAFCDAVVEHNKITNLVSANDSKKLLTRHIADSLMPYIYGMKQNLIPKKGEWADMGSGAGFPVIPLCICIPHLQFFAVEPRKKRCLFLRSIQEQLDLSNLQIIEDTFEKSDFREVDLISCRALGSLEEDYQRAKPALASGGSFITLKSWNSLQPLRDSKSPLLKKAHLLEYTLPQEAQQYVLVHLRSHG